MVRFWDKAFCEGSVFEIKKCVKGPFMDLVLPLDRPWFITINYRVSSYMLTTLYLLFYVCQAFKLNSIKIKIIIKKIKLSNKQYFCYLQNYLFHKLFQYCMLTLTMLKHKTFCKILLFTVKYSTVSECLKFQSLPLKKKINTYTCLNNIKTHKIKYSFLP